MINVFDDFASSAQRFPDRPAVEIFKRAGIETFRYADMRVLADRGARMLHAAGISPGERCALLADNDARWCGAYLGILQLGGVAVPLDTAYTAGQVGTIVRDAGARFLLTSPRYLATSQSALAALTDPPRLILLSGALEGIESLDDTAATGPALPACPATAADPAVILYTSGTTSDPKGVVLTHGNLLVEKAAALKVVDFGEGDSILGILPLFHALAQVANLLLPLTTGAQVVFLETLNSSEMMRALAECRITAFCVVPQFYYLLHQRVMERVAASPWPTRVAFRTLLRLNHALRQYAGLNLGRVLFSQVHGALGGRMRIMVTGGSRFDPAIGRELYAMGLNIIQAYGLTECSGAGTITRQNDPHVDTVGIPFEGVEVRILEEPDTGQGREHGDGEVLIKGPIVMAGYHNRPDATADILRDGWLHTGDLGYFDHTGRLRITGRKKEVIVLSSGKNIYPEEIETVYLQSPFIKDICVMGVASPDEPSAERLHAIVVPNFDLMRERRIVNTREIIRFDVEGLSLKLPHHKRVLSFDIWMEDLPRTTTRKLKRHAIERLYREREAVAEQPAEDIEWSDLDQVWAADAHTAAALEAIRTAIKPDTTLTPDANLELDLGLDSMERVELVASLEHTFNVDVSEETAQRVYTVRELIEAVRPPGGSSMVGAAPAADPWAQIMAEPVEDPKVVSILTPKPLFAPFAFLVMRTAVVLARWLCGLRVTGLDRVPQHGPYVLCPNHQSYLDPFLLVGALPYRVFKQMFSVGASEYFTTPLTAKFAELMNVIPVDPDANLVRAMQAGGFGLRHNRVLILFPEGERSPDGTPRRFKKGASILSVQLGVQIVPVAMDGLFELWPRGKRLQWRRLLPWAGSRSVIAFGDPISPESGAHEPGEDRYARLTGVLRETVVAMWNELETRR